MDCDVKKYTVDDLLLDDNLDQAEIAFHLVNCDVSRDEIFKLLKSDNPELISLAVVHLEDVRNGNEMKILLECLKYNDSRITEPASNLIKVLLSNQDTKFLFKNRELVNTLVDSIAIPNPRSSKNIGEALLHLCCDGETVARIFDRVFQEIKSNNIFGIYWSLFALENAVMSSDIDFKSNENIFKLIELTSDFNEYQIRERTASLIIALKSRVSNPKLDEVLEKLKSDENFYVRNAANKKGLSPSN